MLAREPHRREDHQRLSAAKSARSAQLNDDYEGLFDEEPNLCWRSSVGRFGERGPRGERCVLQILGRMPPRCRRRACAADVGIHVAVSAVDGADVDVAAGASDADEYV